MWMCRADSLTTMELRLPTKSRKPPAANAEQLPMVNVQLMSVYKPMAMRDQFDSVRSFLQHICNGSGCTNEGD